MSISRPRGRVTRAQSAAAHLRFANPERERRRGRHDGILVVQLLAGTRSPPPLVQDDRAETEAFAVGDPSAQLRGGAACPGEGVDPR